MRFSVLLILVFSFCDSNFSLAALPAMVTKEELGKMLFFDPRLSGSNIMSCATCHNPAFHWQDNLPRAVGNGHKTLARRTPTLYRVDKMFRFFWDGRADTLEAQALGPISSPEEMNQDLVALEMELAALPDYARYFAAIFPDRGLRIDTIASALAAFEKTISNGRTPYERWLDGEEQAISEMAQEGFRLFISEKTRCIVCHHGEAMSDSRLWDIGVPGEDLGAEAFRFKTATLWNVADRKPYMHNGSFATLEEVIENYNQGGMVKRAGLSNVLRPLKLSQEDKQALLEFLKTLSGESSQVTIPELPK